MSCETIKYDIYLVCKQSLLNCDTVSVKQKGQDTLRNVCKILYNDVAGIIIAHQKKGRETVQLHVTCHTEYIHKRNIGKSNSPFSKLKKLKSSFWLWFQAKLYVPWGNADIDAESKSCWWEEIYMISPNSRKPDYYSECFTETGQWLGQRS